MRIQTADDSADVLISKKRLEKPGAAGATPKRGAGEGPNGGSKISKAPSFCVRQSLGAGVGGEKKREGLGTLGQEAE